MNLASRMILTWSILAWTTWSFNWWLSINRQLLDTLSQEKENKTEIITHKWKEYEIVWDKKIESISYYWWKRFKWKNTASWEKFDEKKFTAAHKKLPFWTKVMMVDKTTNDTVIVKVNDRWPYVKWRSYDISTQAAKELWNLFLAWHKKVECTIVKEL